MAFSCRRERWLRTAVPGEINGVRRAVELIKILK